MTDIDVDALGPVDYLVVEFPAGEAKLTGEGLEELLKLAESGTIRILDLIMLSRAEDGSVDALELQDADESELGALRDLLGELAVLLAEEDVEQIGATLDPGTAAAVLVYENTWAAPFGSAVRRSGGHRAPGILPGVLSRRSRQLGRSERRARCPPRGRDVRDPSADETSALRGPIPSRTFCQIGTAEIRIRSRGEGVGCRLEGSRRRRFTLRGTSPQRLPLRAKCRVAKAASPGILVRHQIPSAAAFQ